MDNKLKDGNWFFDKLLNEGIDGFFPTGSNYFGLSNDNSDMDFFVKEEIWIKYFKDHDYRISKNYPDNYNVKFLYKNIKFDFIIVLDNNELLVWKHTTNFFVFLLKNNFFRRIVRDKKIRVEVYEFFKDMIREYLSTRLLK